MPSTTEPVAPRPSSLHIAVVGAGLAGLTLARSVAEAGHRVRVFDKSRGPGGRCATRRSDAGPFDHGAPWVQARSAAFADALRADAAQGSALALTDNAENAATPGRWIGVPSMNAWVRRHAEGLAIETERPIAALQAVQPASTAGTGPAAPAWALKVLDGDPIDAVFDRVLLALPAEQAAALLATASPPDQACAMTTALRGVASDPCWTVMAAWPSALPLEANHWQAPQADAPLASAHRQDDRPGRPAHASGADRWVMHASPAWTRDNIDARPEAVVQRLCDALGALAGARLSSPAFAVAHRWRYAQVPAPLTDAFGWDPVRGLGACGDAWHGRSDGALGLERAWLSARALGCAVAGAGASAVA